MELKQLKVLYVEDDEETREALARFLKRRVGKVLTAPSGEEGIEKFNEEKPDIIIADLLMPGINGLEMIEVIREVDTDCRVIITSTVNDVNTIISVVDLGIDHYIIKPIDTEDLENKLNHLADAIGRKRKAQVQKRTLVDAKRKGIVEDEIRKEFLKLLKSASGKGARDVTVLIRGDSIEITAYSTMTALEATVSSNPRNVVMIEQNRKLFYGELACDIEQMAARMIGSDLVLSSVEINGTKGVDKLRLTIL